MEVLTHMDGRDLARARERAVRRLLEVGVEARIEDGALVCRYSRNRTLRLRSRLERVAGHDHEAMLDRAALELITALRKGRPDPKP